MQNNRWKILGDRLPPQSPIEFKDKLNYVASEENNFKAKSMGEDNLQEATTLMTNFPLENPVIVRLYSTDCTNSRRGDAHKDQMSLRLFNYIKSSKGRIRSGSKGDDLTKWSNLNDREV